MAEKHPDVKFEYSFSDGKYWSPYDHCRVWKNGTYDLMIRDNYGQTAKRVYEETNVVEDKEIPVKIEYVDFIDCYGNPVEYYDGIELEEIGDMRPSGKMKITIEGDFNDPWLYIRKKGEPIWRKYTNFSNNVYEEWLSHDSKREHYVMDSYGRKSRTFTLEGIIKPVNPSSLEIKIVHADSGVIITEVKDNLPDEATVLPRRYSISYDNGKSWSDWQLGRYFQKIKPDSGQYLIKAKVKYGRYEDNKNTASATVTIK